MIESVDLNTFEIVGNYVLVKLDSAYDMISIAGPNGQKIELKLMYMDANEVNGMAISGTIIKKPKETFYFDSISRADRSAYNMTQFASLMKNSLQYDVDFKFDISDKVYFNYNAQLDAEKEHRIVSTEEYGLCILISYNSLYGFMSDGEIVPCNGYIFFKRDQNEREVTFQHGIIGIQYVKPYDNNTGTVIIADSPVRSYLDGGRDGNYPFEKGTRIIIDKRYGHRIAYDMHAGELKDFEVCHRKNLLCVLEDKPNFLAIL